MRIDCIQSYRQNTNIPISSYAKYHEKSSFITQKPDVFFCARSVTTTKSATRNLQEEAIKLFQNPEYATTANTLRNIRLGISMRFSGENTSSYQINVQNEHQLNFIETILKSNIEPNHPLMANKKFDDVNKFEETIGSIKSKEDEETKSTAFNLYMKHADVFNPNLLGTLLYFSSTDTHKKYLDFIDENYDDIAERPDISIRHLENYIFYPIYHMGYRKDFAQTVEAKYEKLWNYAMGKYSLQEAFGYNIPDNIDKNSPEYKEHVRQINYIVFDNNNLFDKLKSRPHLSKKEQDAINSLNKITKAYKIPITLREEDIMGILKHDENISAEDLIYIDGIYDTLKDDDRWDFLNALFDNYNKVNKSNHSKYPTNYNEYSRKFLIYMANDAQGGFFENITPWDVKETFLNKKLLESIQTPEQLKTVKTFYNYCFNFHKMPLISGNDIAILIKKYNLNGDDLISINEEIINSKDSLDYDKWDAIVIAIKNGTFKRTLA